MKTAAIYARVSSDQQRENKTIVSQTAALKVFASSQGYSVPAEWIFEDEGFSGAKVRLPSVVAAFGEPGELLVGWIGLGTPQRPPAPKHAKPSPERLLQVWRPR